VVKLGKTFSIFVVLMLLILLAPAVMLSPEGNTAQAAGVVTEVEANFTYNETDLGEWWPFTAGSQGIDPAGLCLAQYSRENVVRTSVLANCGFRNYTAGSGTVTSTTLNLDGTMNVSWLAVNFSQKYSRTPLYHNYGTSAHFGWMAGRGHFNQTEPDNFTFVFVFDFDSDADITNADGKGFMLSIEENGDFAGHKIIGDFDVLKNGDVYTWNLHLRNYDPSEVVFLGQVNVTGQVLQEPTDAIRYGLDLLSFDSDGPQPTQTINHTTDFEEITWGREPLKNVTGGPMGVNGKMDLSRNNALYLYIDTTSHSGQTWIGIQGTPVCNLHIDDSYAQTGDDGSIYGNMWYLLLLDLPNQYLQMVAYPFNFFNQTGYTFTPFGLTNTSTEWYSGRENYAEAFIGIEATAGTAHQFSRDQSYGLYPHPKVESVFPSCGFAGTTMDVKINGKYFLRAAGEKSGWVNNSGSVDFGPNITVNSYTINTNDPIDNSITANITIAGGAGAGPQVVNVTSCFGYTNGNGTAPFLSGTGVFNVGTTGATLEGHVVAYPGYTQGLNVRFFEACNPDFELAARSSTTNTTGVFVLSGLPCGVMSIGIKNSTSLSKMNLSVTLTDNATTVAVFAKPLEGDCDNNDHVAYADYIALLVHYDTYYAPANFDRVAKVGYSDYISLLLNYDKKGDVRNFLLTGC